MRGGTGACLAQEQRVMRLRSSPSLSQQQHVATDVHTDTQEHESILPTGIKRH